ncbi:MAG: hypothetical protein DRH49_04455 [Candidatus Coatesbacteria bacterium]|nr:MAG: hypothetical protein DRH49_04455 [Candidatus Coatesbacteria bacterium]
MGIQVSNGNESDVRRSNEINVSVIVTKLPIFYTPPENGLNKIDTPPVVGAISILNYTFLCS